MTVHKLMTIGIGKYDSMIGIYICIYIGIRKSYPQDYDWKIKTGNHVIYYS